MHAALVSFALVLAVVLFVIFGLLVLSVAGCVLLSFSFSHAFLANQSVARLAQLMLEDTCIR